MIRVELPAYSGQQHQGRVKLNEKKEEQRS